MGSQYQNVAIVLRATLWRPCSVKCAIRHDLLFREPQPSSISEALEETSDEEREDGDLGGQEESDVEEFSWDGLLIEDEEIMYWSE